MLALAACSGADDEHTGVGIAEMTADRGYTFTTIATLGEEAPSGDFYANYFDAFGISDAGDVFFGAGLDNGGEGLFRWHEKRMSLVARSGDRAPGGGTFGVGYFPSQMNSNGDISVNFWLDPFTFPVGINRGVYRLANDGVELRPVLVPYVTLAPGGEPFLGTLFRVSINNDGVIAFPGIVTTKRGIRIQGQDPTHLGAGIYRADTDGVISPVVVPGDLGPRGRIFDFAENPWINDRGDVAFGGHLAGDECIDFGVPQAVRIFCGESIYLWNSETRRITSIAHQGDVAPRGGKYRLAFGPVMNARGEIVYIGDLTAAPDAGKSLGVFRWWGGRTTAIAIPQDKMPGGGQLVTAGFWVNFYSLNDQGDVAFFAVLDTDKDLDGNLDTGVFVYTGGFIRLVARSGMEVPQGTIGSIPGFALVNGNGQVLTVATLTNGKGVLLVATPK